MPQSGLFRWFLFLPTLLILCSALFAQTDPAGRWKGSIKLPNAELGITVDLKNDPSGWSGTIDIPAQGAKSLRLENISVRSTEVSFAISGVPGNPTFKGNLSKNGQDIEGQFTQGPGKFPFQLKRLSPTEVANAEKKAASLQLESMWQGVLKAGMNELRLVLKVYRSPEGELSGKLDSIDQNARNLEIPKITVDGDKFRFEMPNLSASFEGTFNKVHTEIAGQWNQGGASMPLVFKKTDKEVELKRPQEPKPPYPYREEQVTYENTQAGVKLAATLTLPTSLKPVPGVLLITGSGPQDRDETIMGHKPFLVLADYLTRRGFAVLRADDRGVGGSTGGAGATTRDFAQDALSGVAYLKTRREIDPRRIGLIGHSEGGMVAAMAASESPADIDFIVLMAGTGLPGKQILYRQAALIARAAGNTDEEIAANRSLQETMFHIVESEPDASLAEKKIRQAIAARLTEMTSEDKQRHGVNATFIDSQVRAVMSPWFSFFLYYYPRTDLRKVKCPVLAINGSLDLQVPPEEDLQAIGQALKEGGNQDFKTVELPGLNHLFQTATTGAISEYSHIEETISPKALELIASWIQEHTRAG